MNLILVLVIGAVVTAFGAVGIFWVPQEPYKTEIFFASTLKGVLIALLTAFCVSGQSAWYVGLGYGALFGFLQSTVVYLAKGAWKSKDAPFVIPVGVVTGALSGLLIVNYAF